MLSRAITQVQDFFSSPHPPSGRPKRGIRRPAEPELVLRLQAPKRQCIRERDLQLPSQANDLREQHQHADASRALIQHRSAAEKLMDFRLGPFGSGHPLVEPVAIPWEVPEEAIPVEGNALEKIRAKKYNTALAATFRAIWRREHMSGLYTYHGPLSKELSELLTPAQHRIRNRRNGKRSAAELRAEEERKRLPVPTLAQRKAAKDAAEDERKRLLTTRKPAEEYGILARSLAKDRMTALPDTKRFNWGLKQLATGDTEFVSFGPWKNTDWELGPNDNFRVAVCKRVLDFGEDPQPIAFFQKEFRELHDILGEVIERHFGQVRFDEELQNEEGWEVLNRFLLRPVKLGSLIEAVYDNDGNLMTVACDPKRRMEVVQGVIVRILRARVWDSLLFGGTPKQLENVIHEERRLATDNRIEGFARQKKRSTLIKEELRHFRTENGLPQNFLRDVGYVTQEICNLISPLANQLRVKGPGIEPENMGPRENMGEEEQQAAAVYLNSCRQACFADIHNIVHMAGYLAICVRIHPTPIMIDLRTPGIKFEKELDLKVINYDEYRAAKVQLEGEHMDRKEEETIEMKRDLKEAKRRCGRWYKRAFDTVVKNTWREEYEILQCYWLKSENGLKYTPPNEADWRRLLEQGLEGPVAEEDAFTPGQKRSGRWYLSFLRLMELKKKMDAKLDDMKKRDEELREAYIEAYCGHFLDDNIEAKYRRDDDVIRREALVRTAVWPAIKLYQPGNGAPGGEQNGMRSWTITNGEVACHCALPRDKRKRAYNKDALKADQLRATLRAAGDDKLDGAKDAYMNSEKDLPGPYEAPTKDTAEAKLKANQCFKIVKREMAKDQYESMRRKFLNAFPPKEYEDWSPDDDISARETLEDFFSPVNFEDLSDASSDQITYGYIHLAYLLHGEFEENHSDLKDESKAARRFAEDYYYHFFMPERKQKVAKDAREEAGYWHDWALDQLRNEWVGELRANFKRAFREEKRFDQRKGQKEKQVEDGYWTERLEEIYGPEGHPATLTTGRNHHAQKYLAFLRLKVLMEETGVTATDVLDTPTQKPFMTVRVLDSTGYPTTATKLAHLRAAYIKEHYHFYLHLEQSLVVDLKDDEPLEYDYTRDYTTLGEHLNGINGGYRYLVEYPEAATMYTGLTPMQIERRDRRFRKHTAELEAERFDARSRMWHREDVRWVAKETADRKLRKSELAMAEAKADIARDKVEQAKEKAAANAAKGTKISRDDDSDDDDTDGDGANGKGASTKIAPEVWNRMSEAQREHFRTTSEAAQTLKKKGALTPDNLFEKLGLTKKPQKHVYNMPDEQHIKDMEAQRFNGQGMDEVGRPTAKPPTKPPTASCKANR